MKSLGAVSKIDVKYEIVLIQDVVIKATPVRNTVFEYDFRTEEFNLFEIILMTSATCINSIAFYFFDLLLVV